MDHYMKSERNVNVWDCSTLFVLITGRPSSRLEKANDEFMNASRVVWLGVKLREEPLKIWTRYKE